MSGGSNEGIDIATGGDGTGATGTVTVGVGTTGVGMSGGSNEGVDMGAVGGGTTGARGAVPEPVGGSGVTGGDNPKVFWHPQGA